jgi:isocitrate dehydrogenase kinase/phosphatase
MSHVNDDMLAASAAAAIADGYESFDREFRAIARRAQQRFEDRDWHGLQADAVARLDLYSQRLAATIDATRALLDSRATDHDLWSGIKARYADLIRARPDCEIAETFFNSLTRRIFVTIGIDPDLEFLSATGGDDPADESPVIVTHTAERVTHELIAAVLSQLPWRMPYSDLDGDARRVADAINNELCESWGDARIDALDVARPVFFRNKGAYLVARARRGEQLMPIVLPLLHEESGIVVDAALLTADEASIVFSFARSYFHVDPIYPRALIAFLQSIMPRKPVAELYTQIGYNRHGKTELYRDLMRHLATTDDRFEIARGERGMVMIVFTMPSYDVVFKVIKDRFAYPKTSTREDVMARYQLVFKHDRAGRLVDAQEFEYLRFDRARFRPELLEELLEVAGRTLFVEDDAVVIRHLYTERRLTPFNLFVKEADESAARDAVIDYGRCIKDLAAANIFPGDVLLKNFGVTRHGRVVFYDYDELCLLSDCQFRELPPSRDDDDEFSSEPWYYVADGDVFPAEFRTFLGLAEPYRGIFSATHGDLFEVAFWRAAQQRHGAGELADIFPYDDRRRFRRDGALGPVKIA